MTPSQINGKRVTGRSAFVGTDITNEVIPDGVIFIGDSAFSGAKLTSVTLGANAPADLREIFGENINIFYNSSPMTKEREFIPRM
ncbi:MAG: leucine-rich repeat domain-containing protein [Treponema sp.]|nr:leucine-rich repeat domain-containing protein [Treponema sp.]